MEEKVGTLQLELQHARKENDALRFMLEVMSIKCTKLESQLEEEINKEKQKGISSSQIGLVPNLDTRKRARQEYSTAKKPLQVFVRIHPNDDSLILRDGYHWRKYGQKVTKDNASPRAYFRCSMAPSCPAKRKVQKCIHDRSILVATYDGEHNHNAFRPSSSTPKGSSIANKSSPTPNDKEAINTDFAQASTGEGAMQQHCGYGRHNKIEEYANSLIKDPDFTATLAEAVARTITGQHKQQGLNLDLNLSEE